MISRDQRCVSVVDTITEAGLVISLLAEQGIEAEAMNEATMGGVEGLSGWVPRAGIKGMKIWVHDLSQVESAKKILAERFEEVRATRAQREARTGTVEVTCEECAKKSDFPASQQGTVQSCPYCHCYIDVPGEDEEWPQEFGVAEDDLPAGDE